MISLYMLCKAKSEQTGTHRYHVTFKQVTYSPFHETPVICANGNLLVIRCTELDYNAYEVGRIYPMIIGDTHYRPASRKSDVEESSE